MGKKRAPLRKYLDSKGNISKDGDSRLAASGQDSRKKARRSEDTDSGVGSNVAHEDESSGEDSDDDIDLGGTIEEKIENFTFDFKDMHDDYVSSMRTLLMKHIVNPTKALNVALAMAEQGLLFFLCPVNRKLPHHLLKPEEVGTVVTSEDDREDVYAFISVLPVEKVQSIQFYSEFLLQLQKILDSDIRLTSASITDLQKLRSCLFGAERESTGIYFYEKFTNFPLQLIDKLQQALLDDILWARDPSNRNKENERQLAFFQKLQNIVVILPCSDPSTSNGVDVTGWSSPVFDCFEDEVYFQEASIAILFQPDSNLYRSSKAIVALVPFCQMEQIASKIKGLVNS